MLIMNQNRDVLFDTTCGMIRIAYRETTEKYAVIGINGGYGSVEISSHDTEEEAMSALAYIYAIAVAKQPAVSMPKYTDNLEEEAASTILANSLARDCF